MDCSLHSCIVSVSPRSLLVGWYTTVCALGPPPGILKHCMPLLQA